VSAPTAEAELVTVTTRRGIVSEVLVVGPPEGAPVLALHGAGGHLAGEPMLRRLAATHRVYAPRWPGYSETGGEELLDDMLDFALHGADVVASLGLDRPHLLGHSMGGMIAAEMVALSPSSYDKVVLVAPAGLWLDDHPIPDLFAMLPFEFPPYLFHDAERGAALMTGGLSFDDPEAIKTFLIGNSRRLGTAGKIMFPIPNRRLSKRLYRVTNDVLLVWGTSDRLIPTVYASAWQAALPQAELVLVDDAGHMAPYEQPEAVASAIGAFLTS
jgi:pimeloyl-ACP methyl ester carboxylesterase